MNPTPRDRPASHRFDTSNGIVTDPKSGVFCNGAGRMSTKNELKHPLRRACKRAGLRHIDWHVVAARWATAPC